MNYSPIKFLGILLSIITLYTPALSAEILQILEEKSVTVLVDGKHEEYLNPGDVIEVKNKENWKRHVIIKKTSNPNIKSENAIIGDTRLKSLKNDNHIFKPIKNNRIFTVGKKSINIVNAIGEIITLSEGDQFTEGSNDGWKRNIEIIHSKSGYKGKAHLGEKNFSTYQNEKLIESDYPPIVPDKEAGAFDPLEALIKELMQKEKVSQSHKTKETKQIEEEQEIEEASLSCPKNNKVFKIQRLTNLIKIPRKADALPKGSIVKTIKTQKGICYFKVLQTPSDSTVNVEDFANTPGTYPINLQEENLIETVEPSSKIELTKGVKFKLGKDVSLSAIGRRTGKRYAFNDNDVVKIVGKHSNNKDFIVKKNNEVYEYRVSANDLQELNDDSLLEIDIEATNSNIAAEDLFNEQVKETEPCFECTQAKLNELANSPIEEINWQQCRERPVKNSTGKTLPSNNHLENKVPISEQDADIILQDDGKKSMAFCISKSLRSGLDRNSVPSCKKDSNGNIKPEKVRSAVRNENGKFKYWKLLNRKPKACASKKLSTHLADRFVDASRCLGIDPKEIFPIINHESSFQPNAISPTFAIGAGQIVTSNYLDFYNNLSVAKNIIKKGNKKILKDMQALKTKRGYANYENMPSKSKVVSRSTAYFLSELPEKMTGNDPNCKGLKSLYKNNFTVPRSNKKNNTVNQYVRSRENERLCAPKNPDEGFYMAAIFYMQNKKQASFILDKINKKMSPKISTEKMEQWSAILARWMYNGGKSGIMTSFYRLIEKIKTKDLELLDKNDDPIAPRKLNNVKSLGSLSTEEFKKYMRYVLKHRYPSKKAKRRNEVANYVPGKSGSGGIDGDLKRIEEEEIGSCGKTY